MRLRSTRILPQAGTEADSGGESRPEPSGSGRALRTLGEGNERICDSLPSQTVVSYSHVSQTTSELCYLSRTSSTNDLIHSPSSSSLSMNSSAPSTHTSISPTLADVEQEAIATNPAPTATSNKRTRIYWTNEMNMFIWRTYLQITNLEQNTKQYLDPLYKAFTNKFPHIIVTKQRIGDQKRAIINNKMLPLDVLEQIKQEVLKSKGIRTQHNAEIPTSCLTQNQSNQNSNQTTATNTTSSNVLNNMRPLVTKAGKQRQRLQWTDEINKELLRCYYIVTMNETNKSGYRPLLYSKFIESFPELNFLSEQRLSDQIRVILNGNRISATEREAIKNTIEAQDLNHQPTELSQEAYTADNNTLNSTSRVSRTIPNLHNSSLTPTHTNINHSCTLSPQEPEHSEDLETNDLAQNDIYLLKLMREMEIMFAFYYDTDPTTRPKLPRLKATGAFQALRDPDTKILGGEDAPEGAFPSQVSLRMNISAESHFCGASIIRPTWVLTAAHCTVYLRAARITVVVGTNKLSSGGDTYAMKQIINHPNFSDTTYVNDIALLEVAEEIRYYSKVAPMALPDEDTPANTTCVISGWGFTDDYQTRPDNLQMLSVKTISVQMCQQKLRYYEDIGPITQKHICTEGERNRGGCQGDSGGPLAADGKLVGVVSWGIGCASRYPEVYTRVFSYLNWILGIVDSN
ncbi:unnamed protein product [Colias eurytheme]|nr:unnamed protein product [Colias eurytheme]